MGDGRSGVGWPSLRRELKGGRTGSLSKAEGLARKQWVPEGVRCSSGHLRGLRTMLAAWRSTWPVDIKRGTAIRLDRWLMCVDFWVERARGTVWGPP